MYDMTSSTESSFLNSSLWFGLSSGRPDDVTGSSGSCLPNDVSCGVCNVVCRSLAAVACTLLHLMMAVFMTLTELRATPYFAVLLSLSCTDILTAVTSLMSSLVAAWSTDFMVMIRSFRSVYMQSELVLAVILYVAVCKKTSFKASVTQTRVGVTLGAIWAANVLAVPALVYGVIYSYGGPLRAATVLRSEVIFRNAANVAIVFPTVVLCKKIFDVKKRMYAHGILQRACVLERKLQFSKAMMIQGALRTVCHLSMGLVYLLSLRRGLFMDITTLLVCLNAGLTSAVYLTLCRPVKAVAQEMLTKLCSSRCCCCCWHPASRVWKTTVAPSDPLYILPLQSTSSGSRSPLRVYQPPGMTVAFCTATTGSQTS